MTRKTWTLVAAVLASGIVFLDSTVVNVALPAIGRDLRPHFFGTLEGQSYVYNGYLLTLSALLILAGAMSDYYGRKRMFALGLAGFGISSVLCGLAPNMELLVAFRLLQGAAGAMLVPGSLSILTATFVEPEEKGRAFGVWAGASAGTTILGPFVGGVLVDTVSWRAAFLINVPLVALALFATLRHVGESRDSEATSQFDWLGAAIVALGVGGLAFGTIYGQQRNWHDPIAFIALAAGAVALAVLPVRLVRAAHPLVPPELFRSRNFNVTNLSTLLIYGALYVTGYNLGLFIQGTLGYSAAAAGLGFIPGSILLALFSSKFGRLAGRLGPRWFMTVGPVLMGVGILLWARIPAESTAWHLNPGVPRSYLPPISYLTDILPGSLVYGAGLTVLVAPLTTALMTSVSVAHSGVASAVNNAISRIGPQLAGALIFVAITASFYQGLAQRLPGLDVTSPQVRAQISPLNPPGPGVSAQQAAAARSASTDAFHLAMLISVLLVVAGGAVNAAGIRSQQRAPAAAVAKRAVS